jgi:hypothetical protein
MPCKHSTNKCLLPAWQGERLPKFSQGLQTSEYSNETSEVLSGAAVQDFRSFGRVHKPRKAPLKLRKSSKYPLNTRICSFLSSFYRFELCFLYIFSISSVLINTDDIKKTRRRDEEKMNKALSKSCGGIKKVPCRSGGLDL